MRLGRESILSLVKEVLLKLSSVYTPSGEELNAKDVMLQISKELDLPLQIDETSSYYLGSQESKVLLASHIDTVPGFIQPKDEGSAISGRGVVDAKGPLSAMIVASHLLKGDGCDVLVAGLSDEERLSAGAKTLVRKGKRFSHVIVGEPTSTSGIAVEYRGVAHFDIYCTSREGHSSSLKYNLIEDVSRKIVELYSPASEYDKPSIVPTIFRSGSAMNVAPKEAYVHFDVRYSVRNSFDEIYQRISSTFKDCRAELIEHLPPVKTSVNTAVYRALSRALISLGLKPSPVRKWGTSDMNVLAPIAKEIAAYGPGDSKLEHTDYERITYEELYIGTMTYYNAVKELCRNHQT